MVGPLQNAHLGPFPLEKCGIILGTLVTGGYNLFAENRASIECFSNAKVNYARSRHDCA